MESFNNLNNYFSSSSSNSSLKTRRISLNNLTYKQHNYLIPSPFPLFKFSSCSQIPTLNKTIFIKQLKNKQRIFTENNINQNNKLFLTKSTKILNKTLRKSINIKNKNFIENYKSLVKEKEEEEELIDKEEEEEELIDEEEEEYEYISDYEEEEEESQEEEYINSNEEEFMFNNLIYCNNENGIKIGEKIIENGYSHNEILNSLKNKNIIQNNKINNEKSKGFNNEDKEGYNQIEKELIKKEEEEIEEEEDELEECEEEENDEFEEEEEEEDNYLSPWSSRRSDRSTPLSQCSNSTVTFMMNLPTPTGAELPPTSSFTYNNREELRHSSPIDKLVVDEDYCELLKYILSSPSTSSPRNNLTDKTENSDNKQSPRWRADSINEALPLFNNNIQLISELNQQNITTTTTTLPLTNNSINVNNNNNNDIEYKSSSSSSSKTLPILTTTSPSSSTSTSPSSSITTTTTTINSLLPLIQKNNEKNKIEENKYLIINGSSNNNNNKINLNNNNNENISSTFLPQTIIQTNALQQAQQIKNSTKTISLPSQQKNDLILIQNDIIVNNLDNKQLNNNNKLEKQFSSSLSPPPCYQQAANSLRLSPIAGRLAGIPRFYFPLGKPISKAENDAKLNRIKDLFQSFPNGKISFGDFDELCRRMDMAIYIKKAVYDACCRLNNLTIYSPTTSTPENEQNLKNILNSPLIDFNQFIIYWNRMCSEAHDDATKFIFTLNIAARPFNSHYLRKEDFLSILMDLILTHPGLHFLKEAPQFYSKYCEVVIVRIFWNVNRSWSGKITANELRRSNFLQTLKMLDNITDINRITDYFSYEHFYVTYCKFWELDTDHDMVISREDMKRHCNGALTDRIIDRIFSAAVLRTPFEQKTICGFGPVKQQPIETIGFEDFVCFLLAEEDKRHPTSIEYWFRCLDLDGDGQISLYEMEYFYEAIEQKLNSKNMETLALRDVICNLLDSIAPSNDYSITRNDLKKSGLAHRFFNTFVNWIKYVDQESSDGERASVKTVGDKEISDWEVFCLTEYELLMSESEQISNEEEEEEEGIEDENIDLVLDEDDELLDEHSFTTTTTLLNEERKKRLNGYLQQQQQQQQNNHLIA
ncbi:hypothetical protein Mgra_00007861 [Meloidogyne graminicola]|uniref:EF-hand domain-containing protein n=1 Tax=Meloidogyne graminicola TaxID=189291 RepID=A0A8S9ZHA3_9BILA|nr:hypothetical protein Mgra_00007861 [Meloidogyne graminicola]